MAGGGREDHGRAGSVGIEELGGLTDATYREFESGLGLRPDSGFSVGRFCDRATAGSFAGDGGFEIPRQGAGAGVGIPRSVGEATARYVR